MEILFFNEDIQFSLNNEERCRKWLNKLTYEYEKEIGFLNFIFVSEEKILEVNKEYLQHDYFTDIITFDYTEDITINGDIFISIPTVKSNAEDFNQSFDTELNRIIAHGVLHLIGFKDKSTEEKEEMTDAENFALQLLEDL